MKMRTAGGGLVVMGSALALGVRALMASAPVEAPPAPKRQSQEDADRKSVGCVSCHTQSDQKTMHAAKAVRLGCADCHGGDHTVMAAGQPGSGEYAQAKRRAHVLPK